MSYLVTITSQGQISIPAKFRKKLGLKTKESAWVDLKDKKLIIEPIPDLLSLKGSLHHKAIKGKTIEEIIVLEDKAVEEGFIEDYKKTLKK